jgi:hypothetical protein
MPRLPHPRDSVKLALITRSNFAFSVEKNKNLKKQGAGRQTGRRALSASGQIWPDHEWAKRRDDKSYVAAKSFPRWSRNRRFNRKNTGEALTQAFRRLPDGANRAAASPLEAEASRR